MQRKTSIQLASLALLSVLAAPLMAGEGFYAGASVGQAKSDFYEKSFKIDKSSLKGAKIDTDKESTGWKAFIGYQFSPYIGAEAFYVDLGKSELKAKGAEGSGSAELEAKGLGMAGTLTWPVNDQFGLYGKGGFLYWDSSIKLKGPEGSASNDEKDFSPMFGFGAQYSFTDQFSVKVEWERYMDVGKKDKFDGAEIDLISAGIVYSF